MHAMDSAFLIIPVVAFAAAMLTFFSGFGLGTLLAPVFMLFFPIELSIALTALVHFVNNLFKLALVGRHAQRAVLLQFGIPAVLAALLGAWLLMNIPSAEPLYVFGLNGRMHPVSTLNFIMAVLLVIFALFDLLPAFKRMQFDQKKLPLGGLLSGFFGGLSGHQGALRSAFLIKAGLSKEAFIGTAVVVSCAVDFTRLAVYATTFDRFVIEQNITLLVITSAAAIAGAYLGNKLLKKVTLDFVQYTVAVFLLGLAAALATGFV